MNQKNQSKQIITDSSNINNFIEMKIKILHKKQVNNAKQMNSKAKHNYINSKNKPAKKILKTPYHYISNNNNNEKQYNNTFYKNKIENNRENQHKLVVDIKESVKHGRNSSAPSLKQINNKNIKNNLVQNNKINDYKVKDTSCDKPQNNKEYKDVNISSKANSINSRINRINNIKLKLLSKTNKKNYEKIGNNITSYKNDLLNYSNNDINYTNHTDRSKFKKRIKKKEKGQEIFNNTCRNILATQEKIAMLKKKLKEERERLRKSNDYSDYSYNKILNNFGEKINEIENNDEKHITIDNNEEIINMDMNSTQENKDYSANKIEKNHYRDITPDKTKKYYNSYINNFDSIETNENMDHTNSKIGTSYIKENYKANNYKNNMVGYSYNKQSDHVRKINVQKTERDKDIFKNNYNLYNRNLINTERMKNGKKKSRKINIINLKTNENYYYTKSSNIFNTINNKLNKSSIIPKNKCKNLDINKEKKNLNKTKFIASYNIKKNNSVRKGKVKTDLYNNNILNKIIGKRNSDKSKLPFKKHHHQSINLTYEKNNLSKVKKNTQNSNIIDDKNNKGNIKIKEESKESGIEKEKENGIENEKEIYKIYKKIKIIEKVGVICHAGEVSFGKPKTNQDNYFNYKINFDDLIFVGVCDGHGENGHFVSEFLINNLPTNFKEAYSKLKSKEEITFEDIPKAIITKIFEDCFLKTDNDLNELCNIMKKKKLMGEYIPDYFNCDYSGSTCVSLLLKEKNISSVYIANVGDSRVIVIKENENNVWTFEQLSRDHKPTEEDEYKRIIDADGEIEAIEDDNGNWTGPLRVWEKGSEGPGLAMTRSLGDKVGTKIGVICTPEISKYLIKEEDRAFIIASDGLWEYMPNQEVTEAVKELIIDMRENKEINADIIVNELFKQAVIKWRQKEPGMDDITIICILLN